MRSFLSLRVGELKEDAVAVSGQERLHALPMLQAKYFLPGGQVEDADEPIGFPVTSARQPVVDEFVQPALWRISLGISEMILHHRPPAVPGKFGVPGITARPGKRRL